MSTKIRKAEREDINTLIELITALANFEQLPPPDDKARERLTAHGFCDHPKYEAFLAEDSGKAVGYAFVAETYSTFLARPTLYLEDLFVLPNCRGQGIGTALLQFCIQLAQSRDCGRMEWSCLDWNKSAQRLYDGLGAQRMSEWYLYRLTADQFDS